jgi:3-hydroxyisobutyrate dehydrogenase
MNVSLSSSAPQVRPPATIGVIGVGNMGLGMARRLAEGGYAIVLRDALPAREALALEGGAGRVQLAASPAAMAAQCELVVVAVVDAAQCEAVLFNEPQALVRAARPGLAVLLCPTIAPAEAADIAQRLQQQGVECLEAPMSGGPARARDGSMSLMLACTDAQFERWQAVLQQLSSRVFRVGTRLGDGARTKLVNNLLAAVNLAAAAEALALAGRLGLDPALTQQVIAQSSGASWIGSDRMPRALAGDLAPRARTTLLAKDSRLALQMAEVEGAPDLVALGRVAATHFAQACAEGCAALDDASLLTWLAQRDRPAPPARPAAPPPAGSAP